MQTQEPDWKAEAERLADIVAKFQSGGRSSLAREGTIPSEGMLTRIWRAIWEV